MIYFNSLILWVCLSMLFKFILSFILLLTVHEMLLCFEIMLIHILFTLQLKPLTVNRFVLIAFSITISNTQRKSYFLLALKFYEILLRFQKIRDVSMTVRVAIFTSQKDDLVINHRNVACFPGTCSTEIPRRFHPLSKPSKPSVYNLINCWLLTS